MAELFASVACLVVVSTVIIPLAVVATFAVVGLIIGLVR